MYRPIHGTVFDMEPQNHTIATLSCPGFVSADPSQKIVFGAAVGAGRDAQILRQSTNHSRLLPFLRPVYLKDLLCQVI